MCKDKKGFSPVVVDGLYGEVHIGFYCCCSHEKEDDQEKCIMERSKIAKMMVHDLSCDRLSEASSSPSSSTKRKALKRSSQTKTKTKTNMEPYFFQGNPLLQLQKNFDSKYHGWLIIAIPRVYAMTDLIIPNKIYFSHDDDGLFISKDRFWKKMDPPRNMTTRDGVLFDPLNKIDFRSYQQEAHKVLLSKLKDRNTGFAAIYNVPPGFGKTVTALRLFAELRCPCLVLVHQQKIADQWIERARSFLSDNVNIGQLKTQKHKDIQFDENDSCLLYISTIQTLLSEKIEAENLKAFQFIIIDECHHIAAAKFSQCLRKVSGSRLSLTATLYRSDNSKKLFSPLIGAIEFSLSKEERQKNDPNYNVTNRRAWVVPYHPQRWTSSRYFQNLLEKQKRILDALQVRPLSKMDRQKLMQRKMINTNMIDSYLGKEPRHVKQFLQLLKFIRDPQNNADLCLPTDDEEDKKCLDWLVHDLKGHLPKGKILVLSSTIEQMKILHDASVRHNIIKVEESACYCSTSTDEEKRKGLHETCRTLFGCFDGFREAIDIANLQVIIFTNKPTGLATQIVGRGGRWNKEDSCPIPTIQNKLDLLIVHMVPSLYPFPEIFMQKFLRYHREENYSIHKIETKDARLSRNNNNNPSIQSLCDEIRLFNQKEHQKKSEEHPKFAMEPSFIDQDQEDFI